MPALRVAFEWLVGKVRGGAPDAARGLLPAVPTLGRKLVAATPASPFAQRARLLSLQFDPDRAAALAALRETAAGTSGPLLFARGQAAVGLAARWRDAAFLDVVPPPSTLNGAPA